MSILQAAAKRARKAQAANTNLTGMSRILRVASEHFTPEERAGFAKTWTEVYRTHPETRTLRPTQGEILEVGYRQAQKEWPAGILGSVGVGEGKTLAFFLLPLVFEAKCPLLLVPADMISGGNLEEALFEWRQEYDLLPIHIVKGGTIPRTSARTLFVMSYAQLSNPAGTRVLTELKPDIIMCDEVHYLAAPTAARTKRFLRYFNANPETRLIGMSGTITGKSLKDFGHLAMLALRQETFLPEDERATKAWCGVLDADAENDTLDRFLFDPLVSWARKEAGQDALPGLAGEEEVRWAFNYRFSTTPGVICTTSPSCDAELILTGWRDIAFSTETELTVEDAMKNLKKNDELPNGYLAETALDKARAMRELAMGFYYYWDWPDGEVDKEYVLAKKYWDGAVRQYLKSYAREGVDSPWLVEQYVRESVAAGKDISPDLIHCLEEWDKQRHKPKPPTKAAWLDFSVIIAAAEWSKNNEGYIWFGPRAVGEALQAFGIPTFWEGLPDSEVHRRCALSIKVYNKGKNFQAWDNQLFMCVPSDARLWEQALGRQHRHGQKSPRVRATIMQHVWVMRRAWRTALTRAMYIQGSTGQMQRLVFAKHYNLDAGDTFDPAPF